MDDSSALVLGSVSGLESESESVALTEKERRGLGERSAWGLEEEEVNGVEKGFAQVFLPEPKLQWEWFLSEHRQHG